MSPTLWCDNSSHALHYPRPLSSDGQVDQSQIALSPVSSVLVEVSLVAQEVGPVEFPHYLLYLLLIFNPLNLKWGNENKPMRLKCSR